MGDWVIVSKLVIVFYCGLKYINGDMKNTYLAALFILLYIAVNITFYFVKNKNLKRVVLIISILYLAECYKYASVFFILLLPINIFEIMETFDAEYGLEILLSLMLTPFIHRTILPEYIFTAVFSYLVYGLSRKAHKRIEYLVNENDDLREKNFQLNMRLAKDNEHEKQVRYMSQLEERNKIAQDIHDSIGHTISGSLMQLEAARLLIDKNREKADEILENVINVLREGMEHIRSTLRNIKPAKEQIGINKIKLLLDEFTLRSGIKSNLLYSGNMEKIAFIQWKIINDNINEVLTNTLKYSKATSVRVTIEVLNKFVKIEVKDNGIGAYNLKKGLGIRGIEERTEEIGGKVIVDGSMGFSVIFLLPSGGEKVGN